MKLVIESFFTNNGEPALGLNPEIKIREALTGTLIIAGGSGNIMTEIGDGWYRYDFEAQENTLYVGICDGGASLTTADRYTFFGTELESYLKGVIDNTIKILGLSQSNYRIFNPVYNKNNLISGLIKIYPTKDDTDNDTNAITSYAIMAEYNNKGLMTSYKVTEE